MKLFRIESENHIHILEKSQFVWFLAICIAVNLPQLNYVKLWQFWNLNYIQYQGYYLIEDFVAGKNIFVVLSPSTHNVAFFFILMLNSDPFELWVNF